MSSNDASWKALFTAMASLPQPIVGYWRLATGIEFWMILPERADLAADRLALRHDPPILYEEIDSLRIDRRFGRSPTAIEHDLELIAREAAGIDGFSFAVSPDSVEIRRST